MLNPSKGNMYKFVTHTFNAVKGTCPHDCRYCYMKIFPLGNMRFDDREMKTNLGKGNFIFVGSSCDMFAAAVPESWVRRTLTLCREYDKNKYLFQSKNPARIMDFLSELPQDSIIGTTLESDIEYPDMAKAPSPQARVDALSQIAGYEYGTFVTVEPILKFNLHNLVAMIKACKPSFVNIGADSKEHHLPEPSDDEILELVSKLKEFTKVKVKRNAERILGIRAVTRYE